MTTTPRLRNALSILFAAGLLAAAASPLAAEPAPAPATPPAALRAGQTRTADYPFHVQVVGSGRPLVFIPGLSCGADVWTETVARFAPFAECHVVTLAGFAGVPPVEGPFLPTMRDGVIQYLRDQKLENAVLVGHSLGAALSFAISTSAPELVGGVVAVDGLPFFSAMVDPTMTAERARPMAEATLQAMAGQSREQFAAVNTATLAGMMATRGSLFERTAASSTQSDPATVAKAMTELMVTDLRPELAKFPGPVILLGAFPSDAGPQLQAAARAAFEAQLAAAPDAELRAAPETARHFLQFDAPEFLWQAVVDVVRKVEAQ